MIAAGSVNAVPSSSTTLPERNVLEVPADKSGTTIGRGLGDPLPPVPRPPPPPRWAATGKLIVVKSKRKATAELRETRRLTMTRPHQLVRSIAPSRVLGYTVIFAGQSQLLKEATNHGA